MNNVWHFQAKAVFDLCNDMMENCILRMNHGHTACQACISNDSDCAARSVIKYLDAEYIRKGGDLLDLHGLTKNGKPKPRND